MKGTKQTPLMHINPDKTVSHVRADKDTGKLYNSKNGETLNQGQTTHWKNLCKDDEGYKVKSTGRSGSNNNSHVPGDEWSDYAGTESDL